jgi:hypothetical protein
VTALAVRAKFCGDAKVRQFDVAVRLHDDVGGFDVAVEDVPVVEVFES